MKEKSTPIHAFLTVVFVLMLSASHTALGQSESNYVLLKWHPREMGELNVYDECYTSMDSADFKRVIFQKYVESNEGVGIFEQSIPQEEVRVLDSVMFACFNAMKSDFYVQDPNLKFYVDITSGECSKQNRSYRVYGIVGTILLLDRVREKLLLRYDSKNWLVTSLKTTVESLAYDRLCRYAYP